MIPPAAPVLSAEEMRAAEAACFTRGTTQFELMQRAAASVARQAARFAGRRPILVLAGPGNNGGDAFGAAQILAQGGHDVVVAALGNGWQGAAARMRSDWTGPLISFFDAPTRPFIVDGLFGIGLTRPLDDAIIATLTRLRDDAEFVLAIDIASGLNADNGQTLGSVLKADVTLALGALKCGHVQHDGIDGGGVVLLDPLEIGTRSKATTLARPQLHAPRTNDHKFSRGLVAIQGGVMAGAARLAAASAARGGAGYVVLANDDARVPLDAIVHRDQLDLSKAASVLIGPGLGRDERARARCKEIVVSDCKSVFDGDALALINLDEIYARPASTILTPHGGEFAKLFGSPTGDLIAAAQDAAKRSNAVVVLKGAATVIAAPDGQAVVARPPSWLSTAGTGDVLAGLAAARLAVTGDAMTAACEAVWIHMRAAQLAGPAFVADDVSDYISTAIAECL